MKTNKTSKLLAIIGAAALVGLFTTTSHAAAKLRDLDGDGIPNISDPDIDNDGLLNGDDPNVDGGVALSGPYAGRYIGDHYNNNDRREKDIDDDGLANNSRLELDIDGDGLLNTDPAELDIDGDGLLDSDPAELDTDGDGIPNVVDNDDDGDGILDRQDNDDDGDGIPDLEDPYHVGAVLPPAPVPVGDGTAFASISGYSFLTSRTSHGEIKRMSFLSDTSGQEIEGRRAKNFTYTYAANSATTAIVTITKSSREYAVFTLDFSTGGFVKQEFERGRLDETKTGVFTLAR